MKIAYQGLPGAYSYLASKNLFPKEELVAKDNFSQAFESLSVAEVERAVIPVENSTAGRVADVHLLMRYSGVRIIGEYFLPVEHCLLAPKGVQIDSIEHVYSHMQALAQCEKSMENNSMIAHQFSDTAAAAKMVAEKGDPSCAALASSAAAEIYGLDILRKDFQDQHHNTTRFLVLSKEDTLPENQENCLTTLIFKVKHMPAALHKALGVFSDNGINLLKIESYLEGGSFTAAAFYVDVEAHVESPEMIQALKELENYTSELSVLGCYPAGNHRLVYEND